MVCGLEDAGFEIRDSIVWLYGEGMPHGMLDLSRMVGALPGVLPAEAARWQGWATSLKPAHEPIVVARKPIHGSVAANVVDNGVGALHAQACRIDCRDLSGQISSSDEMAGSNGRWPANVVLSHHEGCEAIGMVEVSSSTHFPAERGPTWFGRAGQRGLTEVSRSREEVVAWRCVPCCAVRQLNEQSGVLRSGANPRRRGSPKFSTVYGGFDGAPGCVPARGADAGGASRFFYCAKAPREERDAGLEGFPVRPLYWSSGEASPGTFQSTGTERRVRNYHPTVKPVELMRWLCRLVCPPAGVVVDCFAGSGSTGVACVQEGFNFVGVEQRDDYVAIAEARIRYARVNLAEQAALFD
jgi:site-specific DNA-methyltransferase (adenine-specific)